MTDRKLKTVRPRLEALVAQDRDLLKALVKEALDQLLQAEMTEFLGAAPGERSSERVGYRAGYYERGLITRVGKIELRVPRDRSGQFSTALFERFQRSEKALVSALVEMYVQGVSTRKVKAITEELCGHGFAASTISAINKGLDEGLTKFAQRRLTEDYPYLILDARYEKMHDDGVIQSQAVLIRYRHQPVRSEARLGVKLPQPREPLELAGLPVRARVARPKRRGGRGITPSCGVKQCDRRDPTGGGVASVEELRRRTRVVRIFPT